jgi:hypothetical protein
MMAIGTSLDDFLEEEGLLVGSDEVAIARCRAYMPIDIGFTGTRAGMSDEQKQTLMRLLAKFRKPCRLHHGMCIGADAQAHAICRDMDVQLEGHPPIITTLMATDLEGFAAMRKPLPYLVRNRAIVDATQSLIAAPLSSNGSSGTWFTVNYARSLNRNVTVIFRDGKTETKTAWNRRLAL